MFYFFGEIDWKCSRRPERFEDDMESFVNPIEKTNK